ncbi:MAG: SH3 domain-containing protein, partial [Anaerolineae bacterium]|nr:SH3 domain-containing protein [Anaerolineae bacterium]
MPRRSLFFLCALLALLIPAAQSHAQGAPDAINDALADLSTRVGRNVTLDDLDGWEWTQSNYADTSLDCPQPGQYYFRVITNGYRFLLTFNGVTYDYRVSADRSILILCSGGAAPVARSTATRLPAATPAGRTVCPGAMLSRLETGLQAQASDNGIPKNIRSAPTTGAARSGQVPPGAIVTVVGGPECADGMVWWQIDYDTLTGWVSEGQYNVYWFIPMTAAPPLASTPLPPPGTPAPPQFYGMPDNPQIIGPANAGQLAPVLDLPLGEEINALAWSPDGSVLAAAGQRGTWLYSIAAFTMPPRLLEVPGGPAFGVAFSPDRVTMASAHSDTTTRLWDVGTGGQRAVLRGHATPVRAIAFEPEGALLASGDE